MIHITRHIQPAWGREYLDFQFKKGTTLQEVLDIKERIKNDLEKRRLNLIKVMIHDLQIESPGDTIDRFIPQVDKSHNRDKALLNLVAEEYIKRMQRKHKKELQKEEKIMGKNFRLFSDGVHTHAADEIARLLNLNRGAIVEITKNPSGYLIITKARTNAEKREEWKKKEIKGIPSYVRFVRDGNTLIGYFQYESVQKSAFAICDPNDKFDLDLGKCIVFWRLSGWTIPDYVFED